jgi:hypothetical protein
MEPMFPITKKYPISKLFLLAHLNQRLKWVILIGNCLASIYLFIHRYVCLQVSLFPLLPSHFTRLVKTVPKEVVLLCWVIQFLRWEHWFLIGWDIFNYFYMLNNYIWSQQTGLELVLKKCSEQLQIQDGLCYITFNKFDEIQIQDAVMVPSWHFHPKNTLKNDKSQLSKTIRKRLFI